VDCGLLSCFGGSDDQMLDPWSEITSLASVWKFGSTDESVGSSDMSCCVVEQKAKIICARECESNP
jgi:hypothetical protein